MTFHPLISLILMLCLTTGSVVAQDFEQMRRAAKQRQDQTRTEIQQLMSQIDQYERQIRDVGSRYDQLYRLYRDLQREISLRDEVLRKLGDEQRDIQSDIALTERDVVKLQSNLDEMVSSYKKNLTYMYKYGRVPELALILSAGSLDQMLARAFYLRRFTDHRQKQAAAIRSSQEQLNMRKEELIVSRQEILKSVDSSKRERERMEARRREQNTTIQTLQRDRRSTQQRLDDTRKQIQNLNRALAEAIAEEERIQRAEAARIAELEAERLRRLAEAQRITDAAKREAEVARYSTPTPVPAAAPAGSSISSIEASFEANKGRMQWPVQRGAISVPFGDVVDPVYKTRVPNPGIEVATGSREPVYAIHDGFSSAGGHLQVPEYGNLVILFHGEYKSIYGNLSEVVVRPNSFVRAGELIGYAGTSASAKGESVFLMIKKGQENVNPASWIQPRRSTNP
jgi:septal ring factor EnvC (AmiA/AmiB activator)